MESRACSNGPAPWLPSADPVDVLKALGVRGSRAGVPEGPGLCPQRTPEGDRAFRVGKASTLGVPTWKLFPGESGQEELGVILGAQVTARSELPLSLCLHQMDAFQRTSLC